MAGAISGTDEADGLVQRFGLVAYPDNLGEYRKPTHWPDSAARERAFRVFEALDCLELDALAAQRDERGIPWVRFTAAGQEAWDDWYSENQRRLRSSEISDTPAFASYVAKQSKLVAGLALLLSLIGVVDGAGRLPEGFRVGVSAVCQAAALADFFEAHAAKLYSPELNRGASPARALARQILKGKVVDGASVRDLYRPQWSNLSTPQAVEQAIGILSGLGWLRTEEVRTPGRSSEIVRINPRLEAQK
jgi:putative DNA primase/helicase